MTLLEISSKFFSNKPRYYLTVYEKYFASLAQDAIALLELGVHRGGSLELWAEYFSRAKVVGVDIKDPIEVSLDGRPLFENGKTVPKKFASERIRTYKGSQNDGAFLRELTRNEAAEGWDIIIDDCSHVGELSQQSFIHLFPLLRIGGLYIVEDWGVGYSAQFAEGKQFDYRRHFTAESGDFPVHTAGLSGFVKQFIDELGMDDIRRTGVADRATAFEWVHCYKGVIIVRKARNVPELRGKSDAPPA